MSLARVHNFSISLDGFATGEGQTRKAPFGHAGERLHQWMFATQRWHEMVGEPGGSSGIDDAFAHKYAPGIGAEIMGANKFGHPGWHEDPEWKGAWGPTRRSIRRPSSSPTRRARRSRWRAARPFTSSTLRPSRRSRPPRGRRRPGRAHRRRPDGLIREFLAAGLIDQMHVVVVPILLGRGVRLWDGLEGLETDYEIEATTSPSGVTHVTFARAAA